LIISVKIITTVELCGVLQFIWHYIDIVENGVIFWAHPADAKIMRYSRREWNERKTDNK